MLLFPPKNSLTLVKSGLLPRLLASLRAHSKLARTTSDASAASESLEYLASCRKTLRLAEELLADGKLPETVRSVEELQSKVNGAPPALSRANIFAELKVSDTPMSLLELIPDGFQSRLRSLNDSVEEQLNDAYSRSLRVTSTELSVSQEVSGDR